MIKWIIGTILFIMALIYAVDGFNNDLLIVVEKKFEQLEGGD